MKVRRCPWPNLEPRANVHTFNFCDSTSHKISLSWSISNSEAGVSGRPLPPESELLWQSTIWWWKGWSWQGKNSQGLMAQTASSAHNHDINGLNLDTDHNKCYHLLSESSHISCVPLNEFIGISSPNTRTDKERDFYCVFTWFLCLHKPALSIST